MDTHFTLDAHCASLLARAQVRQSILARVGRTTWGLDTRVLKVTRDALLVSLLRYALTFVGLCLPDDLVRKMDVQVINAASRRITGLPYTTRIEVLHFIAGTRSHRNLYSQHCAIFLHSALLSDASGLQRQIWLELCAIFRVCALDLRAMLLPVDLAGSCVADCSGVPSSVLEKTQWISHIYGEVPDTETVARLRSGYCALASELRLTVSASELRL